MKTYIAFAAAITVMGAAPAYASTSLQGSVEEVSITLDSKKLDRTVAAQERFEMLSRLADRKCGLEGRSLEERKFHSACMAEVKRSVLEQVGDDSLKYVAKNEGVL